MTENILSYCSSRVQPVTSLADATDMPNACETLKDHLLGLDMDLLSVKFCDTKDEIPAIRPFGRYTTGISKLSTAMRSTGGCPLTREALRLLYPFDALQIKSSDYSDFLSLRFLQEMRKLTHNHVAVVPVNLGRGLAIFTVGLRDTPFVGQTREVVVSTICQYMILLIGRFPEIANLFEPKCLSLLEAESLFLSANGFSDMDIAELHKLSEFTVQIIIKNAQKKLDAQTRAQAVSKALAMGEISSTVNANVS